MEKINTRDIWVDYLRVIAMIAVVITHTSVTVFKNVEFSTWNWWLANTINTLSRFAVPMFVMISGYLVLSKDMSVKEFYTKKSVRIIPPILFWSLFYVCLTHYLNNNIDIVSILKTTIFELFIKGKTAPHLWYLSMFICLMAIAPFVNKLMLGKQLSKPDLWYLIGVIVLLALFSEVAILSNHIMGQGISWFKEFPWFVGYFVLGYILGNNRLTLNFKPYLLVIISSIIIMLTLYVNYLLVFTLNIKKDWLILNNVGILNLIITSTIFYSFYSIRNKCVDFKGLKTLANASFGVYFIHPFFMVLFDQTAYFNIISSSPEFISYIAGIIICSFGSIILLRKIPSFKYIS